MKQHIFPIYCVGVALFAAAPYLLLPASLKLPPPVAPPAVDSELSEVVSNIYALDGRRRYRTESAHVRHLRDEDVLTLEPLVMQYYPDAGQAMSLRSESGRVLDRGQRVQLDGAVELDRPAGGGRVRQQMNTRNVEVKVEQWIAVTQERAVLERGAQVTSGRGMVADLKQGHIQLLNEVKVHHAL